MWYVDFGGITIVPDGHSAIADWIAGTSSVEALPPATGVHVAARPTTLVGGNEDAVAMPADSRNALRKCILSLISYTCSSTLRSIDLGSSHDLGRVCKQPCLLIAFHKDDICDANRVSELLFESLYVCTVYR